MARPAEPEKRLELAHQAALVLEREGLDVPMSRIAEALGLNRSTLNYRTRKHGLEHRVPTNGGGAREAEEREGIDDVAGADPGGSEQPG